LTVNTMRSLGGGREGGKERGKGGGEKRQNMDFLGTIMRESSSRCTYCRWSCKFDPTPGKGLRTGTPAAFKASGGPIPLN
jgi:hypothetical protein